MLHYLVQGLNKSESRSHVRHFGYEIEKLEHALYYERQFNSIPLGGGAI